MRKNRIIYTTLLLICVIGFWVFENFYTPANYSDPQTDPNHTPFKKKYLPSSTFGVIAAHQHFLLSYSEPYEQAEWVAYVLNKEHLTSDDRRRPYFIEDPKIPSKSADWRNYKGSGFDRGHLCPAGDRRFSEYAYNETFYTSNISPQKNDFNAGVWNRLEMQVRQWCKRYGTLNVVTGGVLEEGLWEIGDEDVAVPNAFYKVVFRGEGEHVQVLAFLFPHEESNRSLQEFLVSIKTLEKATGIDFFHQMPKTWQENQEGTIQKKGWKF